MARQEANQQFSATSFLDGANALYIEQLYARYQDAEAGFQEKYFAMLRAGGTLRHKELLEPFGLDASDPAFWSKGLGVIEGFIDELEKLS